MYRGNKRFVVDAEFIKNSADNKLSFNEFILLMYFDNGIESVFSIKNISKITSLRESDIMLALSSLIEKQLIHINIEKGANGKITEIVSLDLFYNKIFENRKIRENVQNKSNIYAIFESSFGRTLSGNDYNVIKVWIEKLYSEELIMLALKEAEYNGVTNVRYVDKILYDWNKKGYACAADVKKSNTESKEVSINSSLLDYNWLENE